MLKDQGNTDLGTNKTHSTKESPMAKFAPQWAHVCTLLLGASLASNASAWTTPAVPTPALTTCNRTLTSPAFVSASNAGGDTDRARIQAALNTAATYKSPVVLNAGTFTLAGTLNIATGVTLCSKGGTVLKWSGTSAPQTFAVQATGASNIRIANLTFDGAGASIQSGSSAVIEGNTFKNIKPPVLSATQDVYGWFAVKLVDPVSIAIRQNVFDTIAAGGIAAWGVTGTASAPSTINGNWFGHLNQPISMVNAQYTTVDSNQGYEIERMAVEMIGDALTGTPALDHPGITVTNNRFGNWRRIDTTSLCAGNDVCLRRYEIIALSVVSSTGANVSNNVLDCGTGCVNADKGWGIEFSSYGTASVTHNTVRGFSLGIGAHNGQTLSLNENALFEVNVGIVTSAAGSIDSLTINANQIEAAASHLDNNSGQWGSGIAPQWDHAGAVTLSNNTVTYKTSASRAPVGGEYVGIQVAAVRAQGTPGTISGNRLLIEGTPVAGFNVYGIRLSGTNGSLSGTSVTSNWVAATGGSAAQQGTGLDGGWQDNGTQGVLLTSNVFQNLSHLNRFYDYHTTNGVYMASNNVAINMDGTSAALPSGPGPILVQVKSVTLPTMSLSASIGTQATTTPTLGSTAATFSFTSSIGTSPTAFAPFAWHYGDGRVAAAVTKIAGAYTPGASRVVRALAKDSNGALVTASMAITQQ
jgi:hypothetical protein